MAERLALGIIPGTGWSAREIQMVVHEAEDAGFDAIFTTEVNNDALATAQLLGTATQRMLVGTWVANIYLRHPYVCAQGAALIAGCHRGAFHPRPGRQPSRGTHGVPRLHSRLALCRVLLQTSKRVMFDRCHSWKYRDTMLDKSVKNRFLQQNPRQETRVPAFRNGTLPAIIGVQERTQVSYDTDAQAALNEARHADVWKALSPSDVLATVDDLVAQLLEARHHPVDALVAHGPRYRCVKAPRGAPADARGGGASSGPLLEAAITR